MFVCVSVTEHVLHSKLLVVVALGTHFKYLLERVTSITETNETNSKRV